MRTLFYLLLLANLTLLGYTLLDNVGSGEGVRLAQQVQPDKIRLLTPQQVASLGPDKTAALADVCAEWGPFSDAERARALADLDAQSLGKLLSQKRVENALNFWVYVAPFPNRAAAERQLATFRASGVSDVSVVELGPQRFALSLGIFRSEDAANAHAADLAQRGIAAAKAGPRQQMLSLTALVIRDPPARTITRLKELQPGYPGTEIRIGTCDRPN